MSLMEFEMPKKSDFGFKKTFYDVSLLLKTFLHRPYTKTIEVDSMAELMVLSFLGSIFLPEDPWMSSLHGYLIKKSL